jgi:hypothetical protein
VTVPRLLIDHNFPLPILKALRPFVTCAELVSVGEVEPSWANLPDDQLIRSAKAMSFDGLVTSDDNMLLLPEVLRAIEDTQFTLVVAAGQGHQPIRATGLLFVHIDHLAKQLHPRLPQIWRLRATQKNHEAPSVFWGYLAKRKRTTIEALRDVGQGEVGSETPTNTPHGSSEALDEEYDLEEDGVDD